MMGRREKLNGDGFDVVSRFRHLINWQSGAKKKTKSRLNRRARLNAKKELRQPVD